MKNYDVICVGFATLDITLTGIPSNAFETDTTKLTSSHWSVGGDAVNQAVALGSLGNKAALVSKIGSDRIGGIVMKRVLSGVMCVMMIIVMLVGCGKSGGADQTSNSGGTDTTSNSGGAAPTDAGEKTGDSSGVTIEFWLYNDWMEGAAGDIFRTFAEEFKESTGITVDLVGRPFDDIKSGLVVSASSGTGPDAFVQGLNAAYSLTASGAVQDITEFWAAESDDYKSQFTPAIVSSMEVDGKVWGIPNAGWATMLYRNLDVLEAAGIDTSTGPANWDEWLDQMRIVKENGVDAMNDFSVDGWAVYNFLGGVAGIENTLQDGKSPFTAAQLETCFDFMNEVAQYSTNLPRDDAAADDMFISGKVAFVPHGPWPNVNYAKAAEEGALNYDVVQLPSQDGSKNGGLHGGEWFGITPGENAESAYKWISFLSDAKQMSRFVETMGQPVYNDRAMAEANIGENMLLETQVEAFKGGITDAAYFTPFPGDVKEVSDGASRVITGQQTAAESAAQTVEDINRLIEDNE
ncbi:sugar ABC transporter substrate-binding protein [Bacteroidia bacterium]|nr:sugar ABC transporter substrate-binding protein [Bacteroidia bacterium]